MMDAATGRSIAELDHIQQSCRDILTTRIGTRIMRRDYGSIVPELIDQPTHRTTQLRLMAVSVMALHRWEPRLLVSQVQFSIGMDGKGILDIDGVRRGGQRSGSKLSFKVGVA
ncbi:MAG: GPW/gp25 family protein [Nitrosomonadales bacterium]|nr:GPW/gp25 family protein [Nitrosomonadales bacterium]